MSLRRLGLVLLMAVDGYSIAMAQEPLPRIAIVNLGKEDFAAFFRLLVEEEMISAGFTIVAETDHPEAVLGGVVINPNGTYFFAFGVLRLTLPDGRITWRYSLWDSSITSTVTKIVKNLVVSIKDGTAVPKASSSPK